MRTPLPILSLILVASCSIFAADSAAPATILRHVNVVDVVSGKVLADQSIEINGVTIVRIAPSAKSHPRANDTVFDATGKYAIPGLWDMHVHIAGFNADPKWSARLLPLMVANGVVGVRDMGGDIATIKRWRKQTVEGTLIAPDIVSVGRIIDQQKESSPEVAAVHTPEEARQQVDAQRDAGVQAIKILNSLPRDSYLALLDEARRNHLPVVGHVPNAVTAMEAAELGQHAIEHIFYSNLQFDCSSKGTGLRARRGANRAKAKPDPAETLAIYDEAIASFSPSQCAVLGRLLMRRNVFLTPTLISLRTVGALTAAATSGDWTQFVPAAAPQTMLQAYGTDNAAFWAKQSQHEAAIVRALHEAGVRMMAGTDALDIQLLPGPSLHRELEMLVEAGFTPLQALQAATLEPARFLDREAAEGSLASGKRAEIVLLDSNPLDNISNTQKIFAVVHDGHLYDHRQLDGLLQQARQQ
jgi:imidazolonepropionase-like amidohydrolase